jgi:Mg2+ and Co2+ transporter CorA
MGLIPRSKQPLMTETMKTLGIVAIAVGIVVLVLGLFGMSGGGPGMRRLLAAGVVVLAAGFILYSRGHRRISA